MAHWGRNVTDATGINAIADALRVNASLMAINVGYNKIDLSSARLILDAMKGKNMQFIGMASCNLGVEEAKILAEYMRVMASLTEALPALCAPSSCRPPQSHLSAQVNLHNNNFGEVGWCAIFDTPARQPAE